HPDTAQGYSNLAANLAAQGKHAEALASWEAAARVYEAARLHASASGLGRATFSTEHSCPYPLLAAGYARAGRPEEAWQALESDLGRSLLDEAAGRAPHPWSADERRRQGELDRRLAQLSPPLVALAGKREPTAEDRARLDELLHERAELERQLQDLAVAG